jgi:hypothetical protein
MGFLLHSTLNIENSTLPFLDWLLKNWGLLLLVLAGGVYFCFYVMVARERRATPGARRRPDRDC